MSRPIGVSRQAEENVIRTIKTKATFAKRKFIRLAGHDDDILNSCTLTVLDHVKESVVHHIGSGSASFVDKIYFATLAKIDNMLIKLARQQVNFKSASIKTEWLQKYMLKADWRGDQLGELQGRQTVNK